MANLSNPAPLRRRSPFATREAASASSTAGDVGARDPEPGVLREAVPAVSAAAATSLDPGSPAPKREQARVPPEDNENPSLATTVDRDHDLGNVGDVGDVGDGGDLGDIEDAEDLGHGSERAPMRGQARVSELESTTGPRLVELRPAELLADELRELSGFEEELFEDRQLAGNTAALCNEVLARCLLAAGRHEDPPARRQLGAARRRVAALTVAERDLALLALRRRSLGDRVETLVDCPSCGETNEVDFDLGQLASGLGAIAGRVELTLADGRGAALRPATAGDQAELLALDLDSVARRRSALLARTLLRLGEHEGPFEPDEVHALPTALRRQLEAALAAALPDFELGMDVSCHACGHGFATPFEVHSFFLLS